MPHKNATVGSIFQH